ncbi:MAG: rhodanese-like domain-containing protein [Desulfobacteraceae bacterium]|jgi:hypothetical protein
MKYLKSVLIAVCALFVLSPLEAMSAKAPQTPPMQSKRCLSCHKNYKGMEDIITGNFKSRSNKAKSIQVRIDKRMQVVKYTPETTVKNVPSIKSLKAPMTIKVHYKEVGSDLVATEIVVKPKMEVPKEQLMSVKELEKLVAMGPEKGGYTLVDSRPGIKYKAGHIPTSISIPFPMMKKLKDKLPKDKDRLLIFYCEGMR